MIKKKRAAKKINKPKDKDGYLPQRTTAEIAETHSKQDIPVPQEREAMKSLGTNEQGKELFNFVLNGMTEPKPDKK
ncbi:MAG: hypothetical protein JSU01_05195 [Bacteroidetes bacterium]|nr:hypothetical protein [Bacteroidota bacterium]